MSTTETAEFLAHYGFSGIAMDLGDLERSDGDKEALLQVMEDVLAVPVRDCTRVATGKGAYSLFSGITWPWNEDEAWQEEVSREIVAAYEFAIDFA
jgi:hypothetical protein